MAPQPKRKISSRRTNTRRRHAANKLKAMALVPSDKSESGFAQPGHDPKAPYARKLSKSA